MRYAIPSLEGADMGELAAAGMSIEDGDTSLAILDDESEPSAVDLSDVDVDQAEGESLLGNMLSDDE